MTVMTINQLLAEIEAQADNGFYVTENRENVPRMVKAIRVLWAELQCNYIVPAPTGSKETMEKALLEILKGG